MMQQLQRLEILLGEKKNRKQDAFVETGAVSVDELCSAYVNIST